LTFTDREIDGQIFNDTNCSSPGGLSFVEIAMNDHSQVILKHAFTFLTSGPPPPPPPPPPRPPPPPASDAGITGISPNEGAAFGGDRRTITGFGFLTHSGPTGGNASITFDAANGSGPCATFRVESFTDSQIVGTTVSTYAITDPNNCAGSRDAPTNGITTLRIVLNDNYTISLPNAYTFRQPVG
jgi:hypothetical protein